MNGIHIIAKRTRHPDLLSYTLNVIINITHPNFLFLFLFTRATYHTYVFTVCMHLSCTNARTHNKNALNKHLFSHSTKLFRYDTVERKKEKIRILIVDLFNHNKSEPLESQQISSFFDSAL